MDPMASDSDDQKDRESQPGSIADELKRQSVRLRQLADELKAREAELAEMVATYPHLKRAVYDMLREKFERELPPLPDTDLAILAEQEGAAARSVHRRIVASCAPHRVE